MKNFKKLALVTLFIGFAIIGNAQKIKVESGDLSILKGQKELNVEFVYDGMAVGKFKTEKEYIEKKRLENEAKEVGKGDSWEADWKGDREKQYEPKFIELFNKGGEDFGMSVAKSTAAAKYTVIVKTTFIEPGWNIGITRVPAYINVEISVVETASKNVVSKITMTKTPGMDAMGFDYDSGYRISQSYAKCGKEFVHLVEKKVSK